MAARERRWPHGLGCRAGRVTTPRGEAGPKGGGEYAGGVSPAVKYTLARLGLFAAVLLLLIPVNINVLLKLMIALLVSAAASWFLLRRMREDVAVRIEESMQRRREEKEKLRSALSGEDEKQ
jgi:hypothetical protein